MLTNAHVGPSFGMPQKCPLFFLEEECPYPAVRPVDCPSEAAINSPGIPRSNPRDQERIDAIRIFLGAFVGGRAVLFFTLCRPWRDRRVPAFFLGGDGWCLARLSLRPAEQCFPNVHSSHPRSELAVPETRCKRRACCSVRVRDAVGG